MLDIYLEEDFYDWEEDELSEYSKEFEQTEPSEEESDEALDIYENRMFGETK